MPIHSFRKPVSNATAGQSFPDCLAAALRYLSYRPRTVKEMERRLEGQFAAPVVARSIAYLQDLNYLDDASFCAQWISSRERLRPRGTRALRLELRKLGVEQDLVDEALQGLDETASACNAGRKQAAKLVAQESTPQDFRRKLTPFLQRRGFGYSAIREAADLLWSELQEA